MRRSVSTLATLLLLSAAAAQEPQTGRQFEIDSGHSWIRVLVFRSGLLAGMGHNHTVTSHDVSGSVRWADPPASARFVLRFPADTLIVDDPEERASEGDQFEKPLSARDIEGTRRNMLGRKLLDAENFAEIVVESTRVSGRLPALTVETSVTLKGETRPLEFEANVNLADDQLIATGTRRLSHAELGLRPFSAGLGTLRVADEMLVRFHIVARAVAD